MSELQQLCDQFVAVMRFCASGIRQQEWYDCRDVPVLPVFERWAFDRKAKYHEPGSECLEDIRRSSQRWIWRALKNHVDGAEHLVTALTVYHQLSMVVDLLDSDLNDPVAFARTGFDDLLAALSPLHPDMFQWIRDDLSFEFRMQPEANDLIESLRGIDVEFITDWDDETVQRRLA